MKLGELGFRNIYHKFFAVSMDRTLRQLAQKCDGSLNATHIVLYGYIDSVAGLMLEILGVCNKDKNEFYNAYTGTRMSIRAAELWNYEASAFDSNLDRIEGLYYDRIDDVCSDDGRNGVDGQPGRDGVNGKDGKDGITPDMSEYPKKKVNVTS